MKSYKQILSEVAQPKPADEINFKAKHEIEFMDHPASEEGQHTSGKTKAKRIADYKKGEDRKVYEDVEEENGMIRTQLSFIKYACDEIMEYVETGVDTEEWFQNKLARVHGDMTTLHAYMEGDKRKNGDITMDDMMDESVEIEEEEMTDAQMKRREEIVKGMKKNKEDMQKRYGDNWKAVMYATATKQAMKESINEAKNKELSALEKEYDKLQKIMDRVSEKGGNYKNTSAYKKSKEVYKKMQSILNEAKMTDDHWVIVKRNGNFYSGKSEIKKIVRASKNPPSQKVIERHGGDSAIRVGELRKKLKNMKDTGSLLNQLGEVKIYEKQLDKVNKDALKKDWEDRKDQDIDNDGDTDQEDIYLHKRRQAVTKAMKKESVELDEAVTAKNKKDAEKVIAYAKSNKGKGVATKSGDNSVIPNIQIVRYLESIGKVKNVTELPSGRGWSFELKESVELDEASQPTWNVSVRKAFSAGGVKVKKGDSVEVKARNTAEAIDKAMSKMGISKKDGMGVSGSNFDLKKLKENIELEEAVKTGNVKLNDGSRIKITKDEAEAINNLFDNLSSTGRKKMEKDMMKNKKEFDDVLQFAKEAM